MIRPKQIQSFIQGLVWVTIFISILVVIRPIVAREIFQVLPIEDRNVNALIDRGLMAPISVMRESDSLLITAKLGGFSDPIDVDFSGPLPSVTEGVMAVLYETFGFYALLGHWNNILLGQETVPNTGLAAGGGIVIKLSRWFHVFPGWYFSRYQFTENVLVPGELLSLVPAALADRTFTGPILYFSLPSLRSTLGALYDTETGTLRSLSLTIGQAISIVYFHKKNSLDGGINYQLFQDYEMGVRLQLFSAVSLDSGLGLFGGEIELNLFTYFFAGISASLFPPAKTIFFSSSDSSALRSPGFKIGAGLRDGRQFLFFGVFYNNRSMLSYMPFDTGIGVIVNLYFL